MTIDSLKKVLPQAWSQETSASHLIFDSHNPALGQCAVTALVIQDYLGGEIVNTVASNPTDKAAVSHYFNIIDGQEVDLTRQQFPANVSFSKAVPKTKGFHSTRDYMLSFPSTLKRYKILKGRVEKLLRGSK